MGPRGDVLGNMVNHWRLIPPSNAKVFPDYIPKPLIDDYTEACLIKDASPKASATLSRRCLQGIIRDFWEVKPARLVDEIEAIKDKTDHLTWEAIDTVRKVGNIGAHMEKDINLIVEVDPVHNEHQGKDIGQGLIKYGLGELKACGVTFVITYGNPKFYEKLGFQTISSEDVKPPFELSQPEGWLGLSLGGIESLLGNSSCVKALSNPV